MESFRLYSSLQNGIQRIFCQIRFLLADFCFEHGYKGFHLGLAQSDDQATVQMGAQLGFGWKAGQCGNRGKLPFLETEHIAGEDIAEKVFLQKGVDDGCEFVDRAAGWSADDGGLVCCAELVST